MLELKFSVEDNQILCSYEGKPSDIISELLITSLYLLSSLSQSDKKKFDFYKNMYLSMLVNSELDS